MKNIIKNIIYPNALCGVIVDDCIWFMNHVANTLMKMRILDGVIEEWYQIEQYDLLQSTLFLDMKLYLNKWLVLIPDVCGRHIVIFDLKTKKQEVIEIPCDWFITKNVYWNRKVLLFSKVPTENMTIAELDIENRIVNRNTCLEKAIKEQLPTSINEDSFIDVELINDTLWILICKTGYLFEIELPKMRVIFHEIKNRRFGKVTFRQSDIILSDESKYRITIWNKSDGILDEIDIGLGWDSKEDMYINLKNLNDRIVCLARYSPRIDICELDNSIKTFNLNGNMNFPISYRKDFPFYNCGLITSLNGIVVLPVAGEYFLLIDNDGKVNEIKVKIPMDYFRKAIKAIRNGDFFAETEIGLGLFLECISAIG